MKNDASLSHTKSEQEIEQLRRIILGKNHHVISDHVNDKAREVVGEVLTEAIHDRQKKDGSVNKVLLPIVEGSVEHSVANNSERLIASLYPLMGSLIRKSVGAFLSDFMEKTHQLIEHSFTIKGLKWRIKAWQAGISFTQYVISQTYIYRVEHVLLIHKETGLLLRAVNLKQQSQSDNDLISSMLTAINDFVGDSFQTGQDGTKEQLKTVSTDSFNLLVKPGPNAIIVAAVIGNPPQQVSDQLQITLENIHQLYLDQFAQFNGDNTPFIDSENQLRDCLLTEENSAESARSKKPWLAWLLISLFTIILGDRGYNWYQLEQLNNLILGIEEQPGIVVHHIEVNTIDEITLDIMRDPNAVEVKEWFNTHHIPFENVKLKERRYLSLSTEIIKRRAEKILSQYPDLSLQLKSEQLSLSGNIDITQYQKLTTEFAKAGISQVQLDVIKVHQDNNAKISQSQSINQQVFKELIGKISATQLDFHIDSSQVTNAMINKLKKLSEQYLYLTQLAKQLDIKIGLLLIGSSDDSGKRSTNNKLSMKRAEHVAAILTSLGISREKMFVSGLGQIDIKDVKKTSRKVMFNIIYVDNPHIN